MRRIIYLGMSILIVLACEKAENILSPDPDMPQGIGAGNLPQVTNIIPANGTQLIDQSNQSGIQGLIKVTFSDYMDEATLNTSNIVITNTTAKQDLRLDSEDLEYFPEVKALYIYLDEVPSGSAFLIRLKANIKNTYGSPLDFDEDNIADGSPYDDYLSTFWTSDNTDTLVDVTWPGITTSFNPWRTSNQQPSLDIVFNNVGLGMDRSTLDPDNFSLKSSSGTPYPLDTLMTTVNSVILQPTGNLPLGQNYTLTIKCSHIKKIAKSVTPDYLRYVDGNDNGPQQTEPDTGFYFRVDTIIPPQVNNVTDFGAFARFEFSRLIDESTISSNTIKVYDNNGYVPGEFRIYMDYGQSQTFVEYYYQRTISGDTKAFVSRDVKDAKKDYYLDGNGNEIGGEPWDDYYHEF